MSTFMEHIHRDVDEAALCPREYDPAPSDNRRRPEGRLTQTPGAHAVAVDVIETEHFIAFDPRPPEVAL